MCLKFESTKQRESLLEEDKSYLKKQFEETNDRKSELEKINNEPSVVNRDPVSIQDFLEP